MTSVQEQLAAYRAKKAKEHNANQSLFSLSVLSKRKKKPEAKETMSIDTGNSDTLPRHIMSEDDSNSGLAAEILQSRNVSSNFQQHHGLHAEKSWIAKIIGDNKLVFTLKLLLWGFLFGLFIEWEFGSVFFIISLFYLVYANMRSGPTETGAPSAYSVFNPNCERLDGTFTAEQFEKELRYGAQSFS